MSSGAQVIPLTFREDDGAIVINFGILCGREATQAKSTSMKDMFEQLDRQDRRRKRWGFLKRWAEGVGGLVGLIIYLAVIAGVLIGGGWAFFEFGLPWIKGLMQ